MTDGYYINPPDPVPQGCIAWGVVECPDGTIKTWCACYEKGKPCLKVLNHE